MKKNDFFFGDVSYENGEASIRLSKTEPLVKKVSAAFFTDQLNRVLQEHGGRLSLVDGSSHPNFWEFIDNVAAEKIGFIEIYARQDVNNSFKATLACDIFLLNGVVTVKPHWCPYKGLRADEVVSTLLVPIHLKALQTKTYVRWDDGKSELLVEGEYYKAELEKVFSVAKYPLAMTWGDTPDQKFNEYNLELECATEVGQRGVSSDQALSAYRELLRQRTL